MYIKRTIILTNLKDDKDKMILCLESYAGKISLLAKTSKELKNVFAVVKYNNSPLKIVSVEKVLNGYMGELPKNFECGEEIFASLVEFQTQDLQIKYVGATGNKQQFISELIEAKKYILDMADELNLIEREEENEERLFDEVSEEEIDECIANVVIDECKGKSCGNGVCDECIYKKAFFSNTYGNGEVKGESVSTSHQGNGQCFDTQNEESDSNEPYFDDETLKFYNEVKNSLNNLFENYPKDECLENAIMDSKFVKVDYEKTGDYYSVGVIYENDMPKYIAYALPCEMNSPPPKNMEEFSQYLPLGDKKAYYLMYQKASNGENVLVN